MKTSDGEASADFEWQKQPEDAKAATNLDQAELNAIRNGSGSVEDGVSDERCTNELIDEPNDLDLDSELVATDLITEELVGDAIDQAKNRVRDLDKNYPFALEGASLLFAPNENDWAYRFCLLAALANQFSKPESRKIRACFELLVRDATKIYWGENSDGFRCGHPWDIFSEEHFKSTRQVFGYLYAKIGDQFDWKWSPLEELPDDPSYKRSKDLGVDVVTWKRWNDTRGGQHYLLVQCATTEKGVLSKAADIKKSRLYEYLRIPCTGFARAIATPSCILNPVAIRELSRQAGLVFDRSRIVKITNSEGWAKLTTTCREECIGLLDELI